jgi:NRPS condensation-like uncharacterized protein
MRRVLRCFPTRVKLRSLLFKGKQNNLAGVDRFPLSNGGETKPFILTRKLNRERSSAIKEFGRAQGATLNDVILTAFYRCMFRTLDLKPGAELRIPVMVDMRRYLEKSEEFLYLTNLASTAATNLSNIPGEPFEGTLARVKAVMDKQKSSDIGLNGFLKLDLIFRVLGDGIANRFLRSRLKNPLICMTNVGILDSAQMSFGGIRPSDAILCGSIKYKPYFQLAMSSYNGELTLSANLSGSSIDLVRILAFFDEIEVEFQN